MNNIAQKMDELLKKIDVEQNKEGSFGYLPDIASILAEMRKTLDEELPDEATRSKKVGALGRLLTEDMGFAESSLGTEILNVTEEYAQL